MYIPLYNKSNYSLLSSMLTIDDLVNYAVDNKISSMALSDDTMYGIMEFIHKCQSKNIKPIVGLSVHLEEFSVVLYCKDYLGYQNLIKLSTIQNEGRVEMDDLICYSSHLVSVVPYDSLSFFSKLRDVYSDIYL